MVSPKGFPHPKEKFSLLFDSCVYQWVFDYLGSQMAQDCTDNGYYANCKLIVQAELCNNQYYMKFCCKSCTEAGQLRGPDVRRRKRRRRAVSLA